MTVLAFNSTQIAELKRAAALLPPAARNAFLRQVAGRLTAMRRPLTNGDVQASILAVLGDASNFCEERNRRSEADGS